MTHFYLALITILSAMLTAAVGLLWADTARRIRRLEDSLNAILVILGEDSIRKRAANLAAPPTKWRL